MKNDYVMLPVTKKTRRRIRLLRAMTGKTTEQLITELLDTRERYDHLMRGFQKWQNPEHNERETA